MESFNFKDRWLAYYHVKMMVNRMRSSVFCVFLTRIFAGFARQGNIGGEIKTLIRAVPEPSSLALLGLVGLTSIARRRRNK